MPSSKLAKLAQTSLNSTKSTFAAGVAGAARVGFSARCAEAEVRLGGVSVGVRRGELLFQRASAAKDELLGAVRQAAAADPPWRPRASPPR